MFSSWRYRWFIKVGRQLLLSEEPIIGRLLICAPCKPVSRSILSSFMAQILISALLFEWRRWLFIWSLEASFADYLFGLKELSALFKLSFSPTDRSDRSKKVALRNWIWNAFLIFRSYTSTSLLGSLRCVMKEVRNWLSRSEIIANRYGVVNRVAIEP